MWIVKYFDAAMRNELSEDGTQKWLIGKKDNQIIETVFIPEDKRGTLCISSQVGCLIDCPSSESSFCIAASKSKLQF